MVRVVFECFSDYIMSVVKASIYHIDRSIESGFILSPCPGFKSGARVPLPVLGRLEPIHDHDHTLQVKD